jgi:exonuclease III
MRGIIWNCRGIKKGVTSFLRNLILENNFYFIGLQETMQEDISDNILRQIDTNKKYLWKWVPSRGRSGGILSGINLDFLDVGAFEDGKYSLQLNLWDKQQKVKWNFVNIYGAAQEESKDEFLTELADLLNKNKDSILIGGDLNIIRFSTEKNKGGIHKHSGVFNSIINTYELIDLGMTGGKFTWSNKQNNPTLERLDRYLVSKSWEDIFPNGFGKQKA